MPEWQFFEGRLPTFSRLYRLTTSTPQINSIDSAARYLNDNGFECSFILNGINFYCYRDDCGTEAYYNAACPWLRIFDYYPKSSGLPHIIGSWRNIKGKDLKNNLIQICNFLIVARTLNS